jgi:hypothetical protein
MPPTLQLLEHHLFVHPESCFSLHFSPSSAPSLIELAQHIASSMVYCQHPSFDELTALERFLHASQLLFAAETRRSDIIRISFRYLRHVLPHVWLPCSIATKLLSTLGKIFINGTCLGQRHARNVKLIRLVLYLLHQTRCLWVLKLGGPAVFASDSHSNPELYGCIVQISSLMCDLYDFWGVDELFGVDAGKMLEQEKSNVGTQSLRRLNYVDDDVLYLFFVLYPPFPHHSFHQQKQQQSQFSLEFGEDSSWHERANEQNARAAELQSMLDTLYQHEAKFAEMLQQRHDRIDSMMRVSFCEQKPENDQKRVKALAQTVVAKKLSTENRIASFTVPACICGVALKSILMYYCMIVISEHVVSFADQSDSVGVAEIRGCPPHAQAISTSIRHIQCALGRVATAVGGSTILLAATRTWWC